MCPGKRAQTGAAGRGGSEAGRTSLNYTDAVPSLLPSPSLVAHRVDKNEAHKGAQIGGRCERVTVH